MPAISNKEYRVLAYIRKYPYKSRIDVLNAFIHSKLINETDDILEYLIYSGFVKGTPSRTSLQITASGLHQFLLYNERKKQYVTDIIISFLVSILTSTVLHFLLNS